MGTACTAHPQRVVTPVPLGPGPQATWGVAGSQCLSRLDSVLSLTSFSAACMPLPLPSPVAVLLSTSWPQRELLEQPGHGRRVGEVASVPSSQGTSLTGRPRPRPHADLVLCFGSDRFPVGWLPVVFSLSCTDESSFVL